MSTSRLIRSVPFWVLVGGSVVAIAVGAYLLISKLDVMTTALNNQTATGVEVYAGQVWAVAGALLGGIGLIGLALALTLAALSALIPAAPEAVDVVALSNEPRYSTPVEDDTVVVVVDEPVDAVAEDVIADDVIADAAASEAEGTDTAKGAPAETETPRA